MKYLNIPFTYKIKHLCIVQNVFRSMYFYPQLLSSIFEQLSFVYVCQALMVTPYNKRCQWGNGDISLRSSRWPPTCVHSRPEPLPLPLPTPNSTIQRRFWFVSKTEGTITGNTLRQFGCSRIYRERGGPMDQLWLLRNWHRSVAKEMKFCHSVPGRLL